MMQPKESKKGSAEKKKAEKKVINHMRFIRTW